MSNRMSCFLSARIRIKDGKRKIGLPLPPVSLYALSTALTSLDGLIELIPGKAGSYARNGSDALYTFLLGAMIEGPNEFVNLDITDNKSSVKIRVRTI